MQASIRKRRGEFVASDLVPSFGTYPSNGRYSLGLLRASRYQFVAYSSTTARSRRQGMSEHCGTSFPLDPLGPTSSLGQRTKLNIVAGTIVSRAIDPRSALCEERLAYTNRSVGRNETVGRLHVPEERAMLS